MAWYELDEQSYAKIYHSNHNLTTVTKMCTLSGMKLIREHGIVQHFNLAWQQHEENMNVTW